jgi:hypothetical protein
MELSYEDFVRMKVIRKLPEIEITAKDAEEFFEEIVEPFVKMIEGLL